MTVRPRGSIQILALAPALSQRDVLQANVVAPSRRGPLCCGNLALPLAAPISSEMCTCNQGRVLNSNDAEYASCTPEDVNRVAISVDVKRIAISVVKAAEVITLTLAHLVAAVRLVASSGCRCFLSLIKWDLASLDVVPLVDVRKRVGLRGTTNMRRRVGHHLGAKGCRT